MESIPLTIRALSAEELEELRDDIAQDQLRPYKVNKPQAAAPGVQSGLIAHKPMSVSERETRLERALSGDLSEYGEDRSSAVHGALQLLARKHAGDREAVQEAFEKSQLCEDWGDKWARLGEKEIDKAIQRWEENGKPAWEQEDKTQVTKPRLRLTSFADMQSRTIDWYWPGRLARGHITTFNGDPGTMKSFASIDVAARITTGRAFPDGSKNPLPASSVLVLTREDGLEDTVKPRFLAAGGDPRFLHTITLDGSSETAVVKIEEHLGELNTLLPADTRLLIFDPLIDFLKAGQNDEQAVRDTLTQLKQFAEQRGLSVIGINHLNKKSDLEAIHRAMGAKGMVGVARMNFLFGKDEYGTRHMATLKNNVWNEDGSLKFHVQDSTIEDDGLVISKIGKIVWDGKGSITADELSAPKNKTAIDVVGEWLKEILMPAGTKRPSDELYAAGHERGFSEDQIKRGLKRVHATYERTKTTPSKTIWYFPEVGF